MERLIIIVGGYIGLYPTGGAAWDYIQYPLGLKSLGHDVYYIEDTMQYPVFQKVGQSWNDATASVHYLKGVMEYFGMHDHWAYRDVASGNSFGMTEERILSLCKTADIFINLSCSTWLRDEYLEIPKRVLIDTDPMFTQIQYAKEMNREEETQNWNTVRLIDNHNYLFTFGENIGAADCKIPLFDLHWHTTRQPVCLSYWENQNTQQKVIFTSIMNWSGRKKLLYDKKVWGQKDIEFEKFKEIPLKVSDAQFKVVINKPLNAESLFNAAELKNIGWDIRDPDHTVAEVSDYKDFILQSAAEFSVAKQTYVQSNSGWFSCRSACYLAAGKPVITQDTRWTKFVPSGEGLLGFADLHSAIEAIREVKSNISYHSKRALEIADAYFDSDKVLSDMLAQLN